MPGFPDFGGTNLVHRFAQVFTFSGPMTAGQSLYIGNPPVTKPGYVINFRPQYTAANGVNPFCKIRIRWYDPAQTVDIGMPVEFIIPVMANGVYQPFMGMGPCRGAVMSLHVDNLDTGQGITPFTDVWECTQDIARDDWRGPAGIFGVLSPPGLTYAPNSNIMENVVFATNSLTIPAGGTANYILPSYAGEARLNFNAGGAAGAQFNMEISQFPSTLGPLFLYSNTAPSGAQVSNQIVTLPRQPCLLAFGNAGTQPVTFSGTMTTIEFAS